ncbi:MAG: hypothetical protein VXZ83_05495 [Verrucomicrobiota bacterium]|nr:hypothetical protein [Verrucomicrobiota bacterium]
MRTVLPVNIKKQLSGTWKISEDLKKVAILEIAESIDCETVLTRRFSEQPS